MSNQLDSSGNMLPDSVRLTSFGRFMRTTSIDELPELFNILRGDMSFVGPRPLLMSYLPLYSDFQIHRHDVKPGLSGLAQVTGRNLLSWEDKFELDCLYVRNISFYLDIKIIFSTILIVLTRHGINSSMHATCPPFKGSLSVDE